MYNVFTFGIDIMEYADGVFGLLAFKCCGTD